MLLTVVLVAVASAGAIWALRGDRLVLGSVAGAADGVTATPAVQAIATSVPIAVEPTATGAVAVASTANAAPVPAAAATEVAAAATEEPASETAARPAATPLQTSAPAPPVVEDGTPVPVSWDRDTRRVQHDDDLARAVEAALGEVDGTVGLIVKDLGSGRGVALNPGAELPMASLFKVPVMYSVFNAGVPLGEELEITERIKDFDLGTLELGVGETLTVAEALERMITISDNGSAIMLADRVSATRVNADLRTLGMSSTFYLIDRLNTSAQDMLILLERIARGEAVSPEASAEMVHLLLRQRVADRIPALIPDEIPVAHKTGNLPGVVNDVGIIYGESSTVVVTALVADTSAKAMASRAIARAALAAHEYFEALPESRRGPSVPPQPDRAVPPVRREPRPTPTPGPSPSPAPSPPSAPS